MLLVKGNIFRRDTCVSNNKGVRGGPRLTCDCWTRESLSPNATGDDIASISHFNLAPLVISSLIYHACYAKRGANVHIVHYITLFVLRAFKRINDYHKNHRIDQPIPINKQLTESIEKSID